MSLLDSFLTVFGDFPNPTSLAWAFSSTRIFFEYLSRFFCLNSLNDGIGTLASGYFSLGLPTDRGRLSLLFSETSSVINRFASFPRLESDIARLNDGLSRPPTVEDRLESVFLVGSNPCKELF